MAGSDGFAQRPLRITPDGQAVVDGRASCIELDGVDRWSGGVQVRRPAAD